MRAAAVILLALALAPATSATTRDNPLLVGTVGPDFTIDLTDSTGKHVTELAPGRYDVLVHDLSAEHNFVLGSKTANARLFETDVPFVGDQTFTVDLPVGRYAYACSPHFQVMNGSFAVVPATQPTQVTMLGASVTPSALPAQRQVGQRRPLPHRGHRFVADAQLPPRRPRDQPPHEQGIRRQGHVDGHARGGDVPLRQRPEAVGHPPRQRLSWSAIHPAPASAGSASTTPATRTPNAAASAPSRRLANGRRPRNAILHSAITRPRWLSVTPSCSRAVAEVFDAR